jgi:hypothetical protein
MCEARNIARQEPRNRLASLFRAGLEPDSIKAEIARWLDAVPLDGWTSSQRSRRYLNTSRRSCVGSAAPRMCYPVLLVVALRSRFLRQHVPQFRA